VPKGLARRMKAGRKGRRGRERFKGKTTRRGAAQKTKKKKHNYRKGKVSEMSLNCAPEK